MSVGAYGHPGPGHDARPGAPAEDGSVIEVANEFAIVQLRKVRTRNGFRVQISSPRLETCIELDALSLESLTWQSPEVFSQFLATPFGPAEPD